MKETGYSHENEVTQSLFFHHARPIDHVTYGVVTQTRFHDRLYTRDKEGRVKRRIDRDFESAYQWLEQTIGFYPLFISVKLPENELPVNSMMIVMKEQKKRESQSVLFSFQNVSDGVFMDYNAWHLVLNSKSREYAISEDEKRFIFKPEWDRESWLKNARQDPRAVQFVVPSLDLRKANLVTAHTEDIKQQLEQMQFRNIVMR